jgi:hypothetical protein
MAMRIARVTLGRTRHDLDRPGPLANRLLGRVFGAEASLLRFVSLPFGISILLVGRATEPAPSR